AKHLLHLPVRFFEASVGPDHEVGSLDLFIRRPLCGQTLARFRFRHSTADEPRNLMIGRTYGDDHAIEVLLVTGFIQERNVDDGERRAAEKLESTEPGRNRAVDSGMDYRFELAAGRRVGKHDRRELAPIDGAVGSKHIA